MNIKVMSWNMAGAKLLRHLDGPPTPIASSYINEYHNAWQNGIVPYITINPGNPQYPDVILLQECIGFVDKSDNPSGRWQRGEDILRQIFTNYRCFFFPAFSSHTNPHPGRWGQYRRGSGIPNFLPDYVEAQQGYGICIRDDNQLRKLWVSEKYPANMLPDCDLPNDDFHLCFESINTTTGLYLGGRDTEPRLVILGRIKIETPAGEKRYLNFINLHLTTLKGERDGNIKVNRMAGDYRFTQLDLVLNDIISAYQEAIHYRVARTTETRKDDIWIIGGDFNATPKSEEISLIKRMGFIDCNPEKELFDATEDAKLANQIGTKWSLKNFGHLPIVVDYIFCGLERTTFQTGGLDLRNSRKPYRPNFSNDRFETDHAVLFASFTL